MALLRARSQPDLWDAGGTTPDNRLAAGHRLERRICRFTAWMGSEGRRCLRVEDALSAVVRPMPWRRQERRSRCPLTLAREFVFASVVALRYAQPTRDLCAALSISKPARSPLELGASTVRADLAVESPPSEQEESLRITPSKCRSDQRFVVAVLRCSVPRKAVHGGVILVVYAARLGEAKGS